MLLCVTLEECERNDGRNRQRKLDVGVGSFEATGGEIMGALGIPAEAVARRVGCSKCRGEGLDDDVTEFDRRRPRSRTPVFVGDLMGKFSMDLECESLSGRSGGWTNRENGPLESRTSGVGEGDSSWEVAVAYVEVVAVDATESLRAREESGRKALAKN